MWTNLTVYFAVAIPGLIGLAWILHRMGAAMATCPTTGARARAASLVIGTGFTAIGGGAILIGAALLPEFSMLDVFPALGVAGGVLVCLGLGFSRAAELMRQAILGHPVPTPNAPPAP